HDVGRNTPSEGCQRGEGHLEVELARGPGARRVHESARIEQAGADRQESDHRVIDDLSHVMSLAFEGPKHSQSGLWRPRPGVLRSPAAAFAIIRAPRD